MLRDLYLIYSKIWLNILLDGLPVWLHHKIEKKKPCVSCLGNSHIRTLFWATHIPNIFLPAQGQYKNPIKDWWPPEPSKRRQKKRGSPKKGQKTHNPPKNYPGKKKKKKEELWKLKYFTMQKYNFQNIPLKRNQKTLQDIIILYSN